MQRGCVLEGRPIDDLKNEILVVVNKRDIESGNIIITTRSNILEGESEEHGKESTYYFARKGANTYKINKVYFDRLKSLGVEEL